MRCSLRKEGGEGMKEKAPKTASESELEPVSIVKTKSSKPFSVLKTKTSFLDRTIQSYENVLAHLYEQ